MRHLRGIRDHAVVLLLRAVLDHAEAHLLRQIRQRIHRTQRRFARHDDVRGVVEKPRFTGFKAAALLAGHRVAAHIFKLMLCGDGCQFVPHAALDAAYVRNDAAGLEAFCVLLHKFYHICGIQANINDIRAFQRRGAAHAVDRAAGERIVQGVLVPVKADDRVLRIFFQGLCNGTSDEAQADDRDLHGKLQFLSFSRN